MVTQTVSLRISLMWLVLFLVAIFDVLTMQTNSLRYKL
jgi:hypothetical protein